MKKSILSLVLILLTTLLVAQPSGKWSTGGNAISAGDFIGTTNNFPFDFRVNNVQQMSISTNGVLTLNSLAGTGNRILLSDANGNISALPQGGPDEFLLSNGTWGALPTSATAWKIFGNDISYLGGNLGIGTSSPAYKLDVLGDARVSNNLYVGGGIIVTDKLDASVEVKAGDVIVNNELNVNGNSKISGQLTASQGVLFDNTGTVGISFDPGSTPGTGNVQYGLKVPGFTPPPCAAAPTSLFTHQFGGLLQIYDPGNASSSSLLNLQSWPTVGSTPAGSSIDASLAGTGPSGLLINWFCKSNTYINTNTNGGKVEMGDEVYARRNLQLGANWLAADPNVALNVFDNTTNQLIKLNPSANTVKMISSNNSQFEVLADGTTKIGAGPNAPYKTLTVNGDVAFANYGHPTNGLNAFEILGGNALPTRRGISLDNDPNGNLNFFIHSFQTPAAFNFKDGKTNSTLLSLLSDGQTTIYSSNPLGNALTVTDVTSSKNTLTIASNGKTTINMQSSTGVNAFEVKDLTNAVNFKVMSNGNVYAREVTIMATAFPFPDYVFQDTYNLMPLNEVEKFIKLNHHLPGFKQGSSYEKNGVNVSELVIKQQEKIEELTLYIIELEKRINKIEKSAR